MLASYLANVITNSELSIQDSIINIFHEADNLYLFDIVESKLTIKNCVFDDIKADLFSIN